MLQTPIPLPQRMDVPDREPGMSRWVRGSQQLFIFRRLHKDRHENCSEVVLYVFEPNFQPAWGFDVCKWIQAYEPNGLLNKEHQARCTPVSIVSGHGKAWSPVVRLRCKVLKDHQTTGREVSNTTMENKFNSNIKYPSHARWSHSAKEPFTVGCLVCYALCVPCPIHRAEWGWAPPTYNGATRTTYLRSTWPLLYKAVQGLLFSLWIWIVTWHLKDPIPQTPIKAQGLVFWDLQVSREEVSKICRVLINTMVIELKKIEKCLFWICWLFTIATATTQAQRCTGLRTGAWPVNCRQRLPAVCCPAVKALLRCSCTSNRNLSTSPRGHTYPSSIMLWLTSWMWSQFRLQHKHRSISTLL